MPPSSGDMAICMVHESPRASRGRTEAGSWPMLGGSVLKDLRMASQSSLEMPSTRWKNSLNFLPLVLGASTKGRSFMQYSAVSLMLCTRESWYFTYVILAAMIACSMVCKREAGIGGSSFYRAWKKQRLEKSKARTAYKHSHVYKHAAFVCKH